MSTEDIDVSTQAGLSCPSCGAPLHAGDRFCERCGARLDDEPQPDAAATRVELDLVIAAAVSDQGLVHHRNEDSFHLEVAGDRHVAVVVCDGISSASAGNVAARNAAKAAGAVLGHAVADPDKDASQAIVDAIQAAVDAVVQVEWTTRVKRVDPSCTLVSAVCRGGDITVGWVGDSRAYWFDREDARQLTVDDSFAEEGIAKGLLTPEQAAKSPFLHSITHWVGPDAPERPPRTVSLRPERPGSPGALHRRTVELRPQRRRARGTDRRPARRRRAGGGRARTRRHRERAWGPRQHHRGGGRHRSVGP